MSFKISGLSGNFPNNNVRWGSDFSQPRAFSQKGGIYRSKQTFYLEGTNSQSLLLVTCDLQSLPLDANGNPLPYNLNVVSIYSTENAQQIAIADLAVFGSLDSLYFPETGNINKMDPSQSFWAMVDYLYAINE
ncbi:hypothetical protein [Hafnia alvei]|uniref:Uncharacterized protein n=1 Tax=Hafnia alvei TaxID=569 RepID=A0A1C6Z754_HAFAL|nr:hypothetical protein [Hafnia alvei]NLS54161.1 hypothetical protein [Hafnia alvei]SCM54729.1 hypothetical protein BN1044_04239 [Hafnia alvei]